MTEGFSSIWSVTQCVTSKQMFLIREWLGGKAKDLVKDKIHSTMWKTNLVFY